MNIAQKSVRGLVKAYQKCISPIFPNKCKFVPSCSAYFLEAVEKFGALKGTFWGIKRVLRCNHFSKGGYDPVPENLVGEYKWLL